MFQFPHLPSAMQMNRLNTGTGFPIRESSTKPVRRLIEAYRSLTAPFIRSEERRVGKGVDHGGRRIFIKKKSVV